MLLDTIWHLISNSKFILWGLRLILTQCLTYFWLESFPPEGIQNRNYFIKSPERMIPAVLSNIRNETETMWDIFYSAPEAKRLPHLFIKWNTNNQKVLHKLSCLLGLSRQRPLAVLLALVQQWYDHAPYSMKTWQMRLFAVTDWIILLAGAGMLNDSAW